MAWYRGATVAGLIAVAACGEAFTTADPTGTQGSGAGAGDGGSGARANGGAAGMGGSNGGDTGGNSTGGDPVGGGGNMPCKTCAEAMAAEVFVPVSDVCGRGGEKERYIDLVECICVDATMQCALLCGDFCGHTMPAGADCFDCVTGAVAADGGGSGQVSCAIQAQACGWDP